MFAFKLIFSDDDRSPAEPKKKAKWVDKVIDQNVSKVQMLYDVDKSLLLGIRLFNNDKIILTAGKIGQAPY